MNAKHLLLAVPFFISAEVSAQINYTDVKPDSTISASITQQIQSYYVDLDNDGNYEFELRHFNPEPGQEAVELQGEVVGSKEVIVDQNDHATVLTYGDTVGASSDDWGNDLYGILPSPWYGSGDKYFGFRFKKSGNWHYAWVRVAIPSDRLSFTVKDYAYNSTPNEPIKAGEGIPNIGIHNIANTDKQIVNYPNPFSSETIIKPGFNLHNSTLRIYSPSGELVRTVPNLYGSTCAIKRGALTAGVYFYKIEENGNCLGSGKCIIQD